MGGAGFDEPLQRSLIGAWHQYLQALEPLRPDLFRYCRRLTGNTWDAEDLVHEALLKAFAKLSQLLYTIQDRRAYVLRIATHLWIDRQRARAAEQAALAASAEAAPAAAAEPASRRVELRDAAARLLERLAPQERAAVVLADVFGASLQEAADLLGTSAGAVKSALHRGRERLKEDDDAARARRRTKPTPRAVEAFVERYNARDLPGLLALMRDDAAIEMLGSHSEIGREGFERERGWFHHNFFDPFDGKPTNARWEVASVEGEPVVLVFGGLADADTLSSVMRIEEREGGIQRITVYALCPDVVRAVGEALGHPVRTFGYHFPFDLSTEPLAPTSRSRR